jgi:hypothetical protein
MDMSDLARPVPAPRGPRRTPREAPPAIDGQELVAQLGGEVAAALSAAIERVNVLATTGQIDRAGLRALREEIETARRVGIMGQQVCRLASGRVGVANESLDLTAMLRDALRHRSREIAARGIEVCEHLTQAIVISDATLLFGLLQSLMDWSFEHAVSRIDYGIEMQAWPPHPQLVCRFRFQPEDEVDSARPTTPVHIDTVSWRLVQQTARTLGLLLERRDGPGRIELVIEFPKTPTERIDGLSSVELDGPGAQPLNSKPLAGSHVLVIAARREVRNLIREALRPMGLMLDFVASVEEAREFCAEGVPHAVVYESLLGGARFEELREELMAAVPTLAFIQVTEQGKAFEVLYVGARQFASVGRDAIAESLPSALLFELTRCG